MTIKRVDGLEYKGRNQERLIEAYNKLGFTIPLCGTYGQLQEAGFQVKKGQKAACKLIRMTNEFNSETMQDTSKGYGFAIFFVEQCDRVQVVNDNDGSSSVA